MRPEIGRSSRGLGNLRPPGSFGKGERTAETNQFPLDDPNNGTRLIIAAACD